MQELYPFFDGSQPCRQVDPEIFFPESGTPVESRMAKQLCGRCPFVRPCLAYAIRFQVSGIWGGTTEGERRRIRRARGQHALPVGARTRMVHRVLAEAASRPPAPAGQDPLTPQAPAPQEAS